MHYEAQESDFFLPLGLNLSLADTADGYPQPLLGSEAPPEMRAPERIYAGGPMDLIPG